MRRRGTLLMVLLGLFGIGCGKGLSVDLFAVPDPADPGQSVTWTVTVRNNTQCATIEEPTDLPPPFPDAAGVFAIFLGFIPGVSREDAEDLCRDLMMSGCMDETCLTAQFEESFGPQVAQAVSARAKAAIQQAHEPQQAGTCDTIINDDGVGVIAFCAFDALDPFESDTAMHTDTAPDTGNRQAAQFAAAFGFAEGDDCRPGTEIEEGIWTLGGCFPLATEPAPVLSPLVLGMSALGLLLTGFFGVRHMRRS
jgi:hypothetical protein